MRHRLDAADPAATFDGRYDAPADEALAHTVDAATERRRRLRAKAPRPRRRAG